ncbi:uncharacterized protein LOC143448911 [Clavelina lepadiformis]|uniref:uncharacterized protein LOC143448911 n=1 Tax=Clavelina lepadiformis TaxID=159417 RepID=UPI0040424F3E
MSRRPSSIKVGKTSSKHGSVESFGFEDSYEKRWSSAKALSELRRATPHRYEQSPILIRKAKYKQAGTSRQASEELHLNDSSSAATPEKPLVGARQVVVAEERVPLLKSTPWKINQQNSAPGLENKSSPELSPTSASPKDLSTGELPTNRGSRNTFGTSVRLSPTRGESGLDEPSPENFPPPPSPRTLKRALSVK